MRPLDDFSPAFLGMFRKVMAIEPAIRGAATTHKVDLALAEAVCMYESGGNADLSSRVGAQGYFQVMPATARSLHAPSNIEAGVKYLAQLIERFGREDYALAAYNGGPTRVGRGGPMPLESLQYVLGVGSYRSVLRQYGAAVRAYASRLQLATARPGDTWWTMSERLDVPVLQLRMHNPFLAARPLRAGARVAYPVASRDGLFVRVGGDTFYRVRLGDNYIKLAFTLGLNLEQFRASNALWRLETVLPGRLLAVPPDQGVTFADYTVASGDDLATIAGRSKVDPWWIIRDNGLWDQKVAAGMTLRVRAMPIAPAVAPATAVRVVAPGPTTITYRVRAGDNLTSLSRRYATTVRAIQAANGMGTRTRIVPGQRLRIPSS